METVELLLAAGANVNLLDNGAKTPLTSIIWDQIRAYPNTETIHEDVWTIIDMLLKAGTDLDNCSREFSNPLVMAASFKCAPLVKYLLENGASIKLKCKLLLFAFTNIVINPPLPPLIPPHPTFSKIGRQGA